MATPLKLESRMEGTDTGILMLTGEVDIANREQLREAALRLLAGGAKRLIVDVSGTEYMDSAGLGVLEGLRKRLKGSGGTVAIAGAQAFVKKLFERTGLNQVFPLCEDVAAALKEVGQ